MIKDEYIIYEHTYLPTGQTYVGRTSQTIEERSARNGRAYGSTPFGLFIKEKGMDRNGQEKRGSRSDHFVLAGGMADPFGSCGQRYPSGGTSGDVPHPAGTDGPGRVLDLHCKYPA